MKTRTLIFAIVIFCLGLLLGIRWSRSRMEATSVIKDSKADGAGIRRPGRWRPQDTTNGRKTVDNQHKQVIEKLKTLGYLSGSQNAPSSKGVVTHFFDRTCNGVNLVVSGHAPEALLMNNAGHVLHKWKCGVTQAWPEIGDSQAGNEKNSYWRRAWLMPNGDLYAIFEGTGIIKLDKDSAIIWGLQNGAHHDLHVARNGMIHLLTRKAHINPLFEKERPILEDFITVLSPRGEVIRESSILQILQKNREIPYLKRTPASGDIFHTNTIELIENSAGSATQIWPNGSLILSILKLNLVVVVDPDLESILWSESDFWNRQHQPTLLDNGNLLVFNNNPTDKHRRRSETKDESVVIELEPISRRVVWSYRGNDENPFYSPTCGSCQRLPNGNTLITESDPGRAFEVNRSGEIVWEYLNPHRTGKRKELIATLFEVIRFDASYIREWYGQI